MCKTLALFYLLICSCNSLLQPYVPTYKLLDQHKIDAAWNITQSDGPYSDKEVMMYTSIFIKLWSQGDFLQDDKALNVAINSIEINWQYSIFTYPEVFDKKRLLGLTDHEIRKDKIAIFVATHDGDPLTIEESAYGHELIHVALGAITGDSHPDHFQKEGSSEWSGIYFDLLARVTQEYTAWHENQ